MIFLSSKVTSQISAGIGGLKSALQTAIELEHATLPPYLYALFSIRPGTNQRITQILRSIALEEMLHMALCCNILNAIGGQPSLLHPGFIPQYPGPLPGAVTGVNASLEPLSKSLIKDLFMEIEAPEDPLIFPTTTTASAAPLTIGQFYNQIKAQLTLLNSQDNIFIGSPSRQLSSGIAGIRRVRDLQSAHDAIDLIVEQGEGTPLSPLNPATSPAHYYLFSAVHAGRELVPVVGTPPYSYSGNPIPFDAAGIYPVVKNPRPQQYQGTNAEMINNEFNDLYSQLMRALQSTFDGTPRDVNGSLFLMRLLRAKGAELMQTDLGDGTTAGPTFTYIPPIVA